MDKLKLTEVFFPQTLVEGIRSEVMVIELIQRLIRLPYLCKEVNTKVGLEILKNNNRAVEYSKST